MTTNEINMLKNQIGHFTSLSDSDWALFEPYLHEQTVKRNEPMIKEGQHGRELGFIVEGAMRHYYTRDGIEKTTYFYFENAFVGPYISCLTGQPSLITIEALADTRLIMFPYTRLHELFLTNNAWGHFGRKLAEWALLGLEDRMVGLLTLSPEERYIQLLESNKKKILERAPQHLVANYLGITPVSLSRIRNRITKK